MNPFRRQLPDLGQPRAALPDARLTDGSGVATLRLYDPLDSWGGDWGLSAKEFVATLDALPDDTKEIQLLISSPGGEVWEGLAIINALRSHPAKVVAIVEGIAASAAADIAVSADELHIMKNAEIFIHKAWGLAMGNADDLAKLAADLEHEDRNRASIYADKAGGTVDDWMTALAGETWYSAQEAVDAKLADRVVDPSADSGAAKAKARFDLSVFARKTPTPQASGRAGENIHNPEGADMPSDTFILGLKERLGIKAEVELDEAGLLAAVDEALAESEDDTPPEPKIPEGYALVDQALLDGLRADASEGRVAREQQLADRREGLVQAALSAGRIAPARADAWRAQLKADPGAEQVLASLEPVVALAPIGFTGGIDESSDDDRLYAKLFGTEGEAA